MGKPQRTDSTGCYPVCRVKQDTHDQLRTEVLVFVDNLRVGLGFNLLRPVPQYRGLAHHVGSNLVRKSACLRLRCQLLRLLTPHSRHGRLLFKGFVTVLHPVQAGDVVGNNHLRYRPLLGGEGKDTLLEINRTLHLFCNVGHQVVFRVKERSVQSFRVQRIEEVWPLLYGKVIGFVVEATQCRGHIGDTKPVLSLLGPVLEHLCHVREKRLRNQCSTRRIQHPVNAIQDSVIPLVAVILSSLYTVLGVLHGRGIVDTLCHPVPRISRFPRAVCDAPTRHRIV